MQSPASMAGADGARVFPLSPRLFRRRAEGALSARRERVEARGRNGHNVGVIRFDLEPGLGRSGVPPLASIVTRLPA